MYSISPGPHNPHTTPHGFTIHNASEEQVGGIERTVYDPPTGMLKYLIQNGRVTLDDRIEIDAGQECVYVPYDRTTIESAPAFEDPYDESGERLREHYSGRG